MVERDLIASMYLGDNVGLIKLKELPDLTYLLTSDCFPNRRGPQDQPIEDLKSIIDEMSRQHLRRLNGYLPSGTIDIEIEYKIHGKMIVYNAFFEKLSTD